MDGGNSPWYVLVRRYATPAGYSQIEAEGMGADSVKNFKGDGEGAAAILERHQRRLALADCADERQQLGAQRLFANNFRLVNFYIGARRMLAGFFHEGRGIEASSSAAGVNVEDDDVLPGVVERQVLVRLEEAQLAHALGADAAGGKVGDASRLKLQAHVGDVHFIAEDGQADGANFFHRRAREGEHDVEVVDHQVEDDINIERARREDAEPMDFEEHWLGQQRYRGAHRRVEALELPHLNGAARALGEADELVSFGQRSDQGLLNQDVNPRLHQGAGNFQMRNSRHGDDGGVRLAASQECIEIGKALAFKFGGDALRPRRIAITNPGKFDFAST